MIRKIANLARRLATSRRHQPRLRYTYDTVLRDENDRVIFHGKSTDLSRSGARLTGFPAEKGVALGQVVKAEFLILPKDAAKVVERISVRATVWRVEENEEDYVVALKFEHELST